MNGSGRNKTNTSSLGINFLPSFLHSYKEESLQYMTEFSFFSNLGIFRRICKNERLRATMSLRKKNHVTTMMMKNKQSFFLYISFFFKIRRLFPLFLAFSRGCQGLSLLLLCPFFIFSFSDFRVVTEIIAMNPG